MGIHPNVPWHRFMTLACSDGRWPEEIDDAPGPRDEQVTKLADIHLMTVPERWASGNLDFTRIFNSVVAADKRLVHRRSLTCLVVRHHTTREMFSQLSCAVTLSHRPAGLAPDSAPASPSAAIRRARPRLRGVRR